MKRKIAGALAALVIVISSFAAAAPAEAKKNTGWDWKHGTHQTARHDTGWDIP